MTGYLQLIALAVPALLQQMPLTATMNIKDMPTPLPVVTRTRPADGQVFDRPAIIAIVHITTKAQVEDTDMEGHSLPGAEKKAPFWTYVEATVDYVLRVNERQNTDPDLAEPYLRIEQMDLAERPVPFEFAREYIVFLEPSPNLMWKWKPERSGRMPPYALAIPQGGFEIVGDRVRPLVKGGPLDAYAGRRVREVIDAIQAPAR